MVRFFSALRNREPDLRLASLEAKGLSWPGATVHQGWTSWSGPDRAAGWDMEAVIAEGYERSVWAYRCVELISGSQSRLPFRIARNFGTEDQEVIEKHPLYRVLNRQANPLETSRQFRKRLSAMILLSKKGAFVEVIKSRAGIITRLDLLDPSRVEIIRSDAGDYIAHFEYTRLDGVVRQIDPERIRWIREPHPTDPFCGTTPLEAAGISIELDQLSRQYNVSFIKNDSRPGGVLSVDTDSLTDQEMSRLEARFAPGAQSAGHLSVVASGSGGLNYVDTTTRPRDMAYGEASKNAKDEILAAFGIGESVLGSAAGRTFDNAEQEEYTFWTKPMPPHLDLIASAFARDIDEDLEPYLDTSGVDALEVGQRRKREEARAEVKDGLRSIDEYRPLARLDVLANPQSRALWINPSNAPIPGNPADAAELLGGEAPGGAPADGAMPPEGGAPGGGEQDPGAPTPGEGPRTAAEIVEDAREWTDPTDMSATTGPAAAAVDRARTQQESNPEPGPAAAAVDAARDQARSWLPTPEPETPEEEAAEGVEPGPAAAAVAAASWGIEKKSVTTSRDDLDYEPSEHLTQAASLAINGVLAGLLSRQEGVILARLESPKARKGTPFWRAEHAEDTRAGDAPLDVEKVIDAQRWIDEAGAALSPVVQDAAVEAAAQFINALALAGVLGEEGIDGPAAQRIAAQVTRNVSLAALEALLDALLAYLGRLFAMLEVAQMGSGDIGDLVNVVRKHYAGDGETRWARTIAGDVGHGIATAATEAVAESLTSTTPMGQIMREWTSRRDSRVRPTHVAVDGTTLPVGEPFPVGAELLMYPQDPTASPQERYGCRCRAIYHIDPGSEFTLAA